MSTATQQQVTLPKKGDVVVLKANSQWAKDHKAPEGRAIVLGSKPSGWEIRWPNNATLTVPVTEIVITLPEGIAKAESEAPKPEPKPEPKPKVEKPEPICGLCRCGCGESVATPKARFVSGHDARLDSFCRKAVTGRATTDEIARVEAASLNGWLITRPCGHEALYDHVPCPCTATPKEKKARVPGEPKQTMKDLMAQIADLQSLVLKLTAESEHPDIADPEALMADLDAMVEAGEEA